MFILSVLVFLLIFSSIILIHEWGHFSSARRHGVEVEEFGLGVPPRALTLFTDSKKCKFTLNWIPFGGFVRMKGEDSLEESERKIPGSFSSKPLLARMEIVLAGVFMNFVLAIVLLTGLYIYGAKPILINEHDVKQAVESGIITLGEGIEVQSIIPGGVADLQGVKKGDILLSMDAKKVDSASSVIQAQSANVSHNYIFLRKTGNTSQTLSIRLNANPEGKIGIGLAMFPEFKHIKTIQLPPHKAAMYAFETAYRIGQGTIDALQKLFTSLVVKAQVPQGISGPVGIAAMTHGIVQNGDIEALIKFMALISLSLAYMNVLPIPALDGGRFLFLLIEGVLRKPIPAKWEGKIHFVSYILLILLILLVTGHDIFNLISTK